MPTDDEIRHELIQYFQDKYTTSDGKPLEVDNRSLKDVR